MIANVATIAGSDPSGGAGIQADHKTFAAHGVYGCSVLTACTAQNTTGVFGVHAIPPDFVAQQLRVLLADVRLDGIKTGMLATADIITAVIQELDRSYTGPLVIDPVMVATSGHRLLEPDAEAAMREQLLPRATMITPNLPEAAVLLRRDPVTSAAAMAEVMAGLVQLGAKTIYLKGGHSEGGNEMVDLFWDGSQIHALRAARIETKNTHGTGCSLAAALASNLAQGMAPLAAAQAAHAWLHRAIGAGNRLQVGSGHGPVLHAVDQLLP